MAELLLALQHHKWTVKRKSEAQSDHTEFFASITEAKID